VVPEKQRAVVKMKKPRMGGAGLLGFHYGGNLQWVGGNPSLSKA